MLSEAAILRDIHLALGRRPECKIFRNSVGLAADPGTGQHVRFGLCVGAADLVAIVKPRGRWLALEVKSARGRVRPEQERFLAMIRDMGGVGQVVRSVADAEAALAEAMR